MDSLIQVAQIVVIVLLVGYGILRIADNVKDDDGTAIFTAESLGYAPPPQFPDEPWHKYVGVVALFVLVCVFSLIGILS